MNPLSVLVEQREIPLAILHYRIERHLRHSNALFKITVLHDLYQHVHLVVLVGTQDKRVGLGRVDRHLRISLDEALALLCRERQHAVVSHLVEHVCRLLKVFPPAYNEVVEPSLSTPISDNLTVKVYKGKKLSITADGKTDSVYVPNGNVCDVLNQLGYKLSDDDILSVDKDSNIEDADSITIKRVTYRNETETQSVDFETVKKNSKDVDLGKTKVQTEGKQGEALVTKKCKYVDGKKVSSKTVDTKITKEPVDKVVLMGTKGSNVSNPAGTFTDMNGNTVAYSSVVTGSGTAYTAPAGSLTATGVTAYHGGVTSAVCLRKHGSGFFRVKLEVRDRDDCFPVGRDVDAFRCDMAILQKCHAEAA